MIESVRGNKRSLPYAMTLSELLEKEFGGLEGARKVYLNLVQHINSNTAMRIGFITQEGGTWVRGKTSKKQKADTPVGPFSVPTSSSTTPDDLLNGLAALKFEFSSFREEV